MIIRFHQFREILSSHKAHLYMKELSSLKVEMKLTNLACVRARALSLISGSGGKTLSEKTDAASMVAGFAL